MLTLHRSRFAAISLCTLHALTTAQASAQPEDQPSLPAQQAITNITIIDPEHGAAIAGQTILIEGSRIASVSPTAATTIPADTPTVDGTGLFAIPGLCDAHIHYSMGGDINGKLFIANGVTLVRDMAGATLMSLPNRDRLNRQAEAPDPNGRIGPFMIATGNIIDGSPPVWPMFSEVCETPEQARAAVHKLKDAGVNQIKVYSRLKADVYQAACEEAYAVGLKPVGHIPDSVDVTGAIAAKQYTNEHLQRLTTLLRDALPAEPAATMPAPAADTKQPTRTDKPAESTASAPSMPAPAPRRNYWAEYDQVDPAKFQAGLAALKDSGMIQCPTLVVLDGIARVTNLDEAMNDPRMQYVPAYASQFWTGPGYKNHAAFLQQNVAAMKRLTSDLHQAGVPLIVGTDLANPFVFAGFSVHDELANFVACGLTPAEALRAATTTPAKAFGLDQDHGSIAAGKLANIVLLAHNPLEDIKHTTTIQHVFFAGQHLDRAALDDLLAQAKSSAGR